MAGQTITTDIELYLDEGGTREIIPLNQPNEAECKSFPHKGAKEWKAALETLQ
jgi:hypothetical protein